MPNTRGTKSSAWNVLSLVTVCESCLIKQHYDEDWSLRGCYALSWVNSPRYFEGSHCDFPKPREILTEYHGVTSHMEYRCENLICRTVIL